MQFNIYGIFKICRLINSHASALFTNTVVQVYRNGECCFQRIFRHFACFNLAKELWQKLCDEVARDFEENLFLEQQRRPFVNSFTFTRPVIQQGFYSFSVVYNHWANFNHINCSHCSYCQPSLILFWQISSFSCKLCPTCYHLELPMLLDRRFPFSCLVSTYRSLVSRFHSCCCISPLFLFPIHRVKTNLSLSRFKFGNYFTFESSQLALVAVFK